MLFFRRRYSIHFLIEIEKPEETRRLYVHRSIDLSASRGERGYLSIGVAMIQFPNHFGAAWMPSSMLSPSLPPFLPGVPLALGLPLACVGQNFGKRKGEKDDEREEEVGTRYRWIHGIVP